MKTGWKMLVLAAVLFGVVIAVAYAAQQQGSPTDRHAITVAGGGMMRGGGGGMMGGGGGGRRGGAGQGQGGMGRGMMMMGGPMHGMVMTSGVAASGENVYVLIGDQLMMYDRNLSLQRQVDVKVDWTRMKQAMEQMRMAAPMMEPAPAQ